MKKTILFSITGLAFCAGANSCFAHAIIGDRVFPATLVIDDPGVNDEFNTQVSRTNSPDGWATDASAEFDKRITEDFGLSVSGDWLNNSGTQGFDNIGLGATYVFYKNAPHETMASAQLNWEVGGTGARRIADNFSTLTPTLLFGKGLGDLPDSLEMLKPFAVTGSLGYAVPTERYSTDDAVRSFNPNALEWGGTLQYSLPYLQQHVKDMGWGAPFANAIPVVEVALETPTGGDARLTTGSVNPGVIFMGSSVQLGFEAVIPVNRASGDRVGGIFQLHFYLDDMFPNAMKTLW